MAFSLPRFVRRSSRAALQTYLAARESSPHQPFEWDGSTNSLIGALQDHLRDLPDAQRAAIEVEFDRVEQLADEIGERCLLDSAKGRDELIATFQVLDSPQDRALHVITSDPAHFERAELLAYVERNRRGRLWEAFMAPAGLSVPETAAELTSLKQALKEHFQKQNGTGRSMAVDIFERQRVRGETVAPVIQGMIYVEGLPHSGLEFEGEDVARRTLRPALEVAWTYAPESGELEVLAPGGREHRAVLARLFIQHLFGQHAAPERIPLRLLDLDSLRGPRDFPTDPEDHIAGVSVRRLRLRPFDGAGAITLQGEASDETPLHDLAARWFADKDPLRSGFRVTQATLAIEFRPTGGRKRGKVVTVDLSMPNGSSLKDRTERDRCLSEKYFVRWGLVVSV